MTRGALRNIWAVRDDAGLVHTAAVTRYKDPGDGTVTVLHVATGCVSRVAQMRNDQGEAWVGVHLPKVLIYAANESQAYEDVAVPRFTIVEWNVREVPTCFACVLAESLT